MRGGRVWAFFKPLGQRLAGYAEDAFDAAHARAFKIGFENGLTLFGGIALLGIEGAVLATGFAVKLGITGFVGSVFAPDSHCGSAYKYGEWSAQS